MTHPTTYKDRRVDAVLALHGSTIPCGYLSRGKDRNWFSSVTGGWIAAYPEDVELLAGRDTRDYHVLWRRAQCPRRSS